MSGQAAQLQANAHGVIDWYRARLSETQHDLAFTASALGESQAREGELRGELAVIRTQLDGLQSAVDEADAHCPPSLDDPAFGAWVVEHWAQIEDAKIAHAVEHAGGQPEYVPVGR